MRVVQVLDRIQFSSGIEIDDFELLCFTHCFKTVADYFGTL